MVNIVDRRKSGKNKSVGNRQKFLKRYKHKIKGVVDSIADDKGITDVLKDRKVTVNQDDIDEPNFNFDLTTGERDIILPGNKHLQKGDKVKRHPQEDDGMSSGGSPDGDGFDEFTFTLTKEEFLDLYFSDMCLPNFIKESLKSINKFKWKRTGYSKEGIPPRLDLVKTLKQALARRIATKQECQQCDGHKSNGVDTPECNFCFGNGTKKQRFLDDLDLRYKHFTKQPYPIRQAVMLCVDKDTEYLSPTGWKKISEYDGEQIAQYNDKGEAVFVDPIKYIQNPEEKNFIEIKNSVIDQCVTKEHRVIYKTNKGNLKEITAKELMEKQNSTSNGFRGRIPTSFYIERDGIKLSDAEIQFHIAFKADGTYQRNNKSNTRAQFCFVKPRKVKRLVEILKKLSWEYNLTEFKTRTNIYVSTPYRIEKRFGNEWYEANLNQSKLISEEVKHWDGSSRTFTSKHKQDCDYVQYIWSSNGYGTNLYLVDNCWAVSQCRNTNRSLSSKNPRKIKLVEKSGGSYCFTVPSGMWIARRNGKVFVTGNCLMDVSGSMGEHEKSIAKKFFLLLYLFLHKVYKHVDIIFVSHTTDAKEVSEDEFFYSTEMGGTIVSSGLKLVNEIIDKRIDLTTTNVYISQASDGDNWMEDDEVAESLVEELLTKTQYFAYIQTESIHRRNWKEAQRVEDLMTMYEELAERHQNLQARRVSYADEVYPVLRELFERK